MIVALESASTDLSVALFDGGSGLDAADGWSSAQRQSAEMLPRLLSLCEREGRRLDEASAVAVGIGPGSFTGLRVGMSLAKGLALALGIPIVGIRSLEAWLAADPEAAAALARAGAREAYLLLRGDDAPRIVDRGALPDRIGTARVVAAGELADAFELAGAVAPYGAARSVARLAAERLVADPAGDDLTRLEPAYLRAPRGVALGER